MLTIEERTKAENAAVIVTDTQQQGDPQCDVALHSSEGSLRCSEPEDQNLSASSTPWWRSEVSNSTTGALKVLIFWAIDGLEFRDIKNDKF